jgi:hypothetical protein
MKARVAWSAKVILADIDICLPIFLLISQVIWRCIRLNAPASLGPSGSF